MTHTFLIRAVTRWALAIAVMTATSAVAQSPPQPLADLIAAVQPAVVNLSITRRTQTGASLNIAAKGTQTDQKIQSSGFIIRPSGIIVTNRHVLADAGEIIVTLFDTSRLRATILSASGHSDLALLKVNAGRPLPVLRFGDSDRLRSGDPVLVMGNPLGLGSTATAGIISALDRITPESEAGSFFQVDAPLNVGNSGGPIFNMTGEVIGVGTAFLSPGNDGGSVGLGMAIPASEASTIVDRLLTEGHDAIPWIGIHVQAVTEDIAGATHLPGSAGSIVTDIDPDSPAAHAGLETGDIVVAVGDENTTGPQELNRRLAASAIGRVVQMAIWRNGERIALPVTVGEPPGHAAKAPPTTALVERRGERRDLGLTLAPLTHDARTTLGMSEDTQGALVSEVQADSVAFDRGIIPGSVLLKIGQVPVTSPAEAFSTMDAAHSRGERFVLVLTQDAQGVRWSALPLVPAR